MRCREAQDGRPKPKMEGPGLQSMRKGPSPDFRTFCLCRSVHFDRELGAAHDELEDVPYMDEKPRMSIFQNF